MKEVYCKHGFVIKNGRARSCFSESCRAGEFSGVIVEETVTLEQMKKHLPDLYEKFMKAI